MITQTSINPNPAPSSAQNGDTRALFFTSVPKAGKNVVISFLSRLKFTRIDLKEPELNRLKYQAVYWTNTHHYPGFDPQTSWTYTGPPLSAQQAADMDSDKEQFLRQFTQLQGSNFLHQHFAYNPDLSRRLQDAGNPIVYVCRDPRDILLSKANYYLSQKMPDYLSPRLEGKSAKEIMVFLLEGDSTLVSFHDYLDSFSGWLEDETVLTLRFEDIIGPKGGGSLQNQTRAFKSLSSHCGWNGPEEQFREAVDFAFNPRAGTFFKGRIGLWNEHFDQELKNLFNEKCGKLLQRWNYS